MLLVVPKLLLALILIGAATGCRYMPPPTSPSPTPVVLLAAPTITISLQADTARLNVNTATPIRITVRQDGELVKDGTMVVLQGSAGIITPQSFPTANGAGVASYLAAVTAGFATITATSSGQSASITMESVGSLPPPPPPVIIVPNPPSPPAPPQNAPPPSTPPDTHSPGPALSATIGCVPGATHAAAVAEPTPCTVSRLTFGTVSVPIEAIIGVDWDFGDSSGSNGAGAATNHHYHQAGTYQVTARVTARVESGTATVLATTPLVIP